MKKIAFALCFLLFAAVFTGWLRKTSVFKQPIASLHKVPAPRKPVVTKNIRLHAASARAFIAGKGFNKRFCFLIDMSLPSGRNRFFVYDLLRDTVMTSGLVAHGNCNQYWLEGRRYDNKVGCGCTSLGRYRVGAAYSGRFGRAFKLHGLDSTNGNAYARYVVLHSYGCVPAGETDSDICQSNGCPMVSPAFLKKLEPLIDTAPRPVLLWIFQ